MCGITGIVSKKGFSFENLKQMTDLIIHRGPDDEGYLCSKNVNINSESQVDLLNISDFDFFLGFGHRRLSIVDLSKNGHQPMPFLNRYWIVFNGEIYNYVELKEELVKKGYVFFSNTDTETVMAAYDCWGVDCFNRFNGMWSFVIFDTKTKELIISRDRFGIKPFYYYLDINLFLFSSEIKPIHKSNLICSSPNIGFCRKYLQFGCNTYEKETEFSDIYRFTPASYAIVNVSELFTGGFIEKKYWSLSINSTNQKFNSEKALEYSNKYFSLLKESVKIRLRADVEVGTALSGGLDSSSIAAIINILFKESGVNCSQIQNTFSTIYPSSNFKEIDELDNIRKIQEKINVRSHYIEPNLSSFVADYKKVIYYWECLPYATNTSAFSLYSLVSENDIKVLLNGQGADEQLAGYYFFFRGYIALSAEPIRAFFQMLSIPGSKLFLIQGLCMAYAKKMLGEKNAHKFVKVLTKANTNPYISLNEQLYQSTINVLINLLHSEDRNSMRCSIESRLPYLDYRLVEFLAQVPMCYKIHRGWTKYIARLAMEDILPPDVVWRREKIAWSSPLHFLLKENADEIWTIINNSLFIKDLSGKKISRSVFGNKKWDQYIFRLLTLELWHTIFFQESIKTNEKINNTTITNIL